MANSFEFTLHSPLTKDDWAALGDYEHEHSNSVTFQTPKGKQVKYIKADILDKIRAEITEKENALDCAKVSDVALKTAYIEALKIIDKYRQEG